jgi:PAS domain S-box-containing protein
MNASYPESQVACAKRAGEEGTQVPVEPAPEHDQLANVLEFLCRAMEDESVDRVIACIHPLNEDATMFRGTVAPSLDNSYRESTDGVLVSSMTGPCCQAVATRQTAVVPDLTADPKWVKFREFADPLGIRSAWSTPIFSSEGNVLGTFAHYYFEARDPSPRDERMVRLLSRAAAVAIERGRAEAALRELNETLEQRVQAETRERLQIWNVSLDLLVIASLNGKYLSVNPAWTAILGWSEEDLLGKSYQWLLHPDDQERTGAELERLAHGHKTLRFENRLRAKDGSYHWIAWNAASDRGRIYGMGRDITERKQAEETLRHVIDTIPTLAWCNLPDGTNEFLNRNWHEYTGLSPNESYGWGWQAAFHPEDLPALMEKWKGMLISGEPGEIEARLRRSDGVYRWFLIRAEPFRDETGNILRWYGTSTDIDDRKRAEEELRRNEAFLAEGQRLSLTGSFSWKTVTNEITWSEQLYRLYEFEIGVPVTLELIRSRVHPEDLTLLEKMVEQAQNRHNDFEWHHRLVMPDNSIKYLHAVAHARQDQNGQLEYIATVQDVTQQRSSEEALAKARLELAQVARVMSLATLTASIAHEVNQPLAGIVTNASTCLRMLSSNPPNIEGARETARRTIRDGNRASDVITRLRTLFSKKDAAFEALDLNKAAREVIALCLSELQRNRVVLRTELGSDLPAVSGDRVQLQQVMLNLLRNGSEAMHAVDDRARELLIRTERDAPDSVRISVKDVGVGLEAHALEKPFAAFYTTKADGMGIGLSISRSIIEGHHGRLWAMPNDGPGATFCFSIPCTSKSSTSKGNKAAERDAA